MIVSKIGQVRRRRSERGSALLIVFVFAAVVAIMLYRELPIAVFEARRTKEEVLVERGHEYERAVQLYYRKFKGQYPVSFDQLENMNSMRFLRRRYKDPFTGKDDWRLLHAGGPNGQLIDSKVSPLPLSGVGGQTGQSAPGGFGSSASSFGSNSASAFGSNSTIGSGTGGGSTTTSTSSNGGFGGSFGSSPDSGTATEVPGVPKRAPVVDAAGTTATGETPTSSDLNQDPSIPLLPSGSSRERGSAAAAGAGSDGSAPQPQSGAGPSQPAATGTGAANSGLSTVSNANSSTMSSSGRLMSGGLAGVASRAKGEAIKKVNDQTDYSLWEFWYDPTKDTSMGNGTNMQNGAGGQNVQNGTSLGQPSSGSGFGSGTNSLFNNTNNSSQPTPAPGSTTAPNFAPAIPGASQQLQNSTQPPPNNSEPPNDGNTPVVQPPPIPQQG